MTASEPVELHDLDLVRLAQGGDTEAFGVLVERNRRAVFRAALAAVGTASEADDVSQDTFITAYRKLASFRGDAAFKTWLLSIAWRKAVDRRKGVVRWLKFAGRHRDVDDESGDVFDRVPSPGRSHEERLVGLALQRDARRMIATLPCKLRDPLLLAGSGEHTYQQIAEMLQVPLGTVKWRVSEARRIVRLKLEAAGHAIQGSRGSEGSPGSKGSEGSRGSGFKVQGS